MAWTIVGHTTKEYQASKATSTTIDVPSGVQDGDLMIMFRWIDINTGFVNATTGWSDAPSNSYLLADDKDAGRFSTQYREASSEPSNYTVNFTASRLVLLSIIAVRGHDDGNNSYDAFSGYKDWPVEGNSDSPAGPNIYGRDGELCITMFAADDNDGKSNDGYPSGFTGVFSIASTEGADGSHGMAYKELTSNGNVGTNSFLMNASEEWIAETICLVPGSSTTTYTKTSTIDALIKKTGITRTLSIDAMIQEQDLTESTTLDAILVSVITEKITIDAFLQALKTSSVSIDALLQDDYLVSTTIDALLQEGYTVSTAIDAFLATTTTISLSIDALLQDEFNIATTLDAFLQSTFTTTASIDALLKDTFTESTTIDALLVSGTLVTTAIDAYLQSSFTIDTSIDAFLQDEFNITTSIDAILEEATSGSPWYYYRHAQQRRS